MKNIDLYQLSSAFYNTPGVKKTSIINGYYPNDTIRVDFDNNIVATIGTQEAYPEVALYTLYLYSEEKDLRRNEPFEQYLYYDFSNDGDYQKGAEDITATVMQYQNRLDSSLITADGMPR